MSLHLAEHYIASWKWAHYVDPDDWYEAMAVLLAERASA